MFALGLMLSWSAFAPDEAKGTLAYKATAKDYLVELRHAYLIRVPDLRGEKVAGIRRRHIVK